MENVLLKKKINDFLVSDAAGEGKKLSKSFKDGVVKFLIGIVSDEVKAVRDSIPMSATIPESDARVADRFTHYIGDFVYYVLFKQVRSQVPGKLQVHFGWQFTVLSGKVEEIQIRADHGILYKINGDWALQDVVYKTEKEALAKCRILNAGTSSVAIKEVEDNVLLVPCDKCGKEVDVHGEWWLTTHGAGDELFEPVLCKECYEAVNGGKDGDEAAKELGSSVDNGASEAGVDSASESN